ncbi:MAG: hypothetical protein IPJ06_02165 [Saprospiraceae bacterium]|nr:hypothetical protein [Saprospiraceae bacterium]
MKNPDYPGMGIALGAGIGAALGVVFGNIAIGVATGVGAGVAIAYIVYPNRKRRRNHRKLNNHLYCGSWEHIQ